MLVLTTMTTKRLALSLRASSNSLRRGPRPCPRGSNTLRLGDFDVGWRVEAFCDNADRVAALHLDGE